LLALCYFCFFRAPSEAEMIAKFQQRRTEFEQIRLMLQQDQNQDQNIDEIFPTFVRAKWGDQGELPLNVSEARLALYRSRLSALGFSSVRRYEGKIQLGQFAGGFADTTWSIGYIWSAQPLTPLVESAYSSRPQRDHRHYSRLGGNWYLYHRR
jgi:hypothetical protein